MNCGGNRNSTQVRGVTVTQFRGRYSVGRGQTRASTLSTAQSPMAVGRTCTVVAVDADAELTAEARVTRVGTCRHGCTQSSGQP